MKNQILLAATLLAIAVVASPFVIRAKGQNLSALQTFEFATIRWGGKEHTHLIRPNGQVEMLGPILSQVNRPDRVDDRALLLTVAMNAVAKEGYEFAGMTSDMVVLKRPVAR